MDDIRWHQRLSNYRKALQKLTENVNYIVAKYGAVDFDNIDLANNFSENVLDIYKQGLIQSFEFTHELAWKVMKDFAEDQGNIEIRGSKDATRYAANVGLIENAHDWMNMILSRNETSHTYNESTANEIFENIMSDYHSLLLTFEVKLKSIKKGEQGKLF